MKLCFTLIDLFLLPGRKKGRTNNDIFITNDQYRSEKKTEWDKIFNMNKIIKIGGRNKKFDYQFQTDGLSICLLYAKIKRTKNNTDHEQLIKDKYANNSYDYAVGKFLTKKNYQNLNRNMISNKNFH